MRWPPEQGGGWLTAASEWLGRRWQQPESLTVAAAPKLCCQIGGGSPRHHLFCFMAPQWSGVGRGWGTDRIRRDKEDMTLRLFLSRPRAIVPGTHTGSTSKAALDLCLELTHHSITRPFLAKSPQGPPLASALLSLQASVPVPECVHT